MSLATALLVLVAAADPAKPARPAEVKPVQVVVDARAGCADADRFFDGLRARTSLVRRATEDEPGAKSLRVRLLEMRRYVMGELRLVDDRGEALTRKVQGPSCDDVVQALALAAAVALDPSVLFPGPDVLPPPSREAPPTATSSSPATSTAVATNATAVAPTSNIEHSQDAPAATASGAIASVATTPATTAPRSEPRFHLGAASVAAFPLSSGPSLGLALFGRWTPTAGSAAGAATATAFRPTLGLAAHYLRNDLAQSREAVKASLVGLVASACGRGWGGGVMTVKPCALLTAGLLSVSGDHAVYARSVHVLWLGAGAAVRAAIDLGRGFALELEAGASVPLLRREFYVSSPSHVVDRTSTVSPEAGLGIAHGF